MTVNKMTGSTQKLVTACIKPDPHHSALSVLLSQAEVHDCRWPPGYDRQSMGLENRLLRLMRLFCRVHCNFKAILEVVGGILSGLVQLCCYYPAYLQERSKKLTYLFPQIAVLSYSILSIQHHILPFCTRSPHHPIHPILF